MAMNQTDKCLGHDHPEPTTDERCAFHAALYDALASVDKAWGLANRTPSFHEWTDRLGQVMADLTSIKRVV